MNHNVNYKVIKPLRTEKIGNSLWKLTDNFSVKLNKKYYFVPKGFITNGASVPRMFWWFCAPMAGCFGEAAVIHDYRYSKQSRCVDRKFADKALRDIGKANGASSFRAAVVYGVVRMFGERFWKKN